MNKVQRYIFGSGQESVYVLECEDKRIDILEIFNDYYHINDFCCSVKYGGDYEILQSENYEDKFYYCIEFNNLSFSISSCGELNDEEIGEVIEAIAEACDEDGPGPQPKP